MSMIAYSGRFTVHEDRVEIDVDVAWMPSRQGERQIRYFHLEGDRLTLRTPVQESPLRPGRLMRGTILWERET